MSALIGGPVIAEPSSLRLLDLGCGPGLYAAQFARLGFAVHGIDFSRVAIEHAETQAKVQKLSISYECCDMRTLAATGAYEAVTMIFGGFCVLSNRDRLQMLRKIARALVPGGLFIFDVFRRSYVRRTTIEERWYTSPRGGFWMGNPHLVLERSFEYPDQQVNLNRYIVVTGAGEFRAYNVWRHWYDEASVRRVVENAGFETLGTYGDLCGSPAGDEWIGVVARKKR